MDFSHLYVFAGKDVKAANWRQNKEDLSLLGFGPIEFMKIQINVAGCNRNTLLGFAMTLEFRNVIELSEEASF